MAISTAGAPLPAEPAGRFYEVVTPKNDDRLRCVLLSDMFTGYWLHWDGCPLRCTMQADCRWCIAKMAHRWQGYIAAWHLTQHRRIIPHLSEGTARQLAALQEEYGGLAGVGVEIRKRFPTKVNSSYIVTPIGNVKPADFYEPHPVEDSVNRLLGINEIRYVHKSRPVPAAAAIGANAGVPLPSARPAASYGTGGKEARQAPSQVVKTRDGHTDDENRFGMQDAWRAALQRRGNAG